VWDQRSIALHLGGSITFVGGLNDLNIVIVGLADLDETTDINPLQKSTSDLFMDEPVRGDIVFCGSDEDGEEMDVDIAALMAWLHKPKELPVTNPVEF